MRYTYLFTQISREENGKLVPVTDKPYEFVFTFGKKIDTFLEESPDNTVLFTKDMWKEYPTDNKELLPTVCFSAPSQKGYTRPLIMSKDADKRAGVYKYDSVGEPIDLKKGQYLSDKIRTLTETFVKGVRVINEDNVFIHYEDLEKDNVKHLMSYITSEVYKYLLQDKDNRGEERAEDFLKNVLETFFSLIPDSIIEKFDKGLKVHDKIREKLEGIPKDDTTTIKAVLKSQNYFKTFEDYKLFVVLYKYILSVKNVFNHLVWVIFRSKIGLVTLTNVKKQLSAMFGFVIKVQDNYEPMENKDIVKKICGGDRYNALVEGFLNKLYSIFDPKNMNKAEQAALCFKFQEEINHKCLDIIFYYYDEIVNDYRPFRQERFRDLCLQYWGIEEKNTYRPCKCEKQMEALNTPLYNSEVWGPMRKVPK